MDLELFTGYAGLIGVATLSIYAGSYGSLPKRKQVENVKHPGDDYEDDDDAPTAQLTAEEAWIFPVLGSITLFSLYLVIKFLGKEWINRIMGWYFSVAGLYSVSNCTVRLARSAVGTSRWRRFSRYQVKFPQNKPWVQFSWRSPSLLLVPVGFLPSLLSRLLPGKPSALLTDILALSFAHEALTMMKVDSWRTGCILLSGLFVYDIWWVFGTNVMVSVATSLDVPIKLLWPKSLLSPSSGFMMLGLGDIVVPGIFVALALRYDYHRHVLKGNQNSKFAKPYFTAALSAYTLGLVITMAVMHGFKSAQPALLYLSPSCILSFVVTAVRLGELGTAWEWSDEENNDKDKGMQFTMLLDVAYTAPVIQANSKKQL
ncbi:signal peptide peptidase-domain-containing protein [Amylostereum chailletii]|nr:signal peptide peptidase-domain-containing protein [Amylostereum chailletii]